MGDFWIANSQHKKEQLIQHIEETYEKDHYLIVTVKTGKQRSLRQNSALHLWCDHVAKALTESGQDMKKVLSHHADIPWTQSSVKDYLWRPVQESQTNEKSTTKVKKIDYVKIYDILNRYLSENLGISVPWPVNDRHTS